MLFSLWRCFCYSSLLVIVLYKASCIPAILLYTLRCSKSLWSFLWAYSGQGIVGQVLIFLLLFSRRFPFPTLRYQTLSHLFRARDCILFILPMIQRSSSSWGHLWYLFREHTQWVLTCCTKHFFLHSSQLMLLHPSRSLIYLFLLLASRSQSELVWLCWSCIKIGASHQTLRGLTLHLIPPMLHLASHLRLQVSLLLVFHHVPLFARSLLGFRICSLRVVLAWRKLFQLLPTLLDFLVSFVWGWACVRWLLLVPFHRALRL